MNTPNKQSVAIQEPGSTQVVVGADTYLDMIERAARDPAVDMDKMERLMAWRDREMARVAEHAFHAAMRAAQSEMGTVGADATNPQTRSKYATYAKLDSVLRPIYTNHGFSLSFDEEDCAKPDYIRVVCYVAHEAGHTRTYRKDMPADGKGAKGGDVMTKTHATGAAASYGARYLLKGIFNIAVGEEDRDGNTGPGASVDDEQIQRLQNMIVETGSDPQKFFRLFKVETLESLPAAMFEPAMATLKVKLQSQRTKAPEVE